VTKNINRKKLGHIGLLLESTEEEDSRLKQVDVVEKSLLTISEASKQLNVHANTLRKWEKEGFIKVYRIGPRGDRRFDASEIKRILL